TINDTAPDASYNMIAFEVLAGPGTNPSDYQAATASDLSAIASALASQKSCSSKPVYVSEFGAATDVAYPGSGPGSPEHQQAVMRGTYAALQHQTALHITGGMIFQMAPYVVSGQAPFGLIDWFWSFPGPVTCTQTQSGTGEACTSGIHNYSSTAYMPAYYDLPTIMSGGSFS